MSPHNQITIVPPRLRVDGDTALAIALSTSLKEEEERRKRTSLDEFAVATLPPRLEAVQAGDAGADKPVQNVFSILMSPKPKEKQNKRKRKNK